MRDRDRQSFIAVFLKWIGLTIALSSACIGLYYITFRLLFDGLKHDLESTYINNLFETGRFTAIPGLNVSIFHFLLLNVLLFWIVRTKTKLRMSSKLFAGVLAVVLLYIIFIGVMYIQVWGPVNVEQYGEYLTGFDKYMYVIEGTMGLYWIYAIVKGRVC